MLQSGLETVIKVYFSGDQVDCVVGLKFGSNVWVDRRPGRRVCALTETGGLRIPSSKVLDFLPDVGVGRGGAMVDCVRLLSQKLFDHAAIGVFLFRRFEALDAKFGIEVELPEWAFGVFYQGFVVILLPASTENGPESFLEWKLIARDSFQI